MTISGRRVVEALPAHADGAELQRTMLARVWRLALMPMVRSYNERCLREFGGLH